MVSYEKQFVFIRIPKAAGTSIDRSLKRYCINDKGIYRHYPGRNDKLSIHNDAADIRDEIGKNLFLKYFKFCVVRNPWSRMVGSFFHWKYIKKIKLMQNMEFRDGLYSNLIYLDDRIIRNQCDWILDGDNLIVDRVLRLENIQKEWKDLCDELELHADLPHINKSSHDDYKIYYKCDKDIEKVREIYKKDIEYFNYSFKS